MAEVQSCHEVRKWKTQLDEERIKGHGSRPTGPELAGGLSGGLCFDLSGFDDADVMMRVPPDQLTAN